MSWDFFIDSKSFPLAFVRKLRHVIEGGDKFVCQKFVLKRQNRVFLFACDTFDECSQGRKEVFLKIYWFLMSLRTFSSTSTSRGSLITRSLKLFQAKRRQTQLHWNPSLCNSSKDDKKVRCNYNHQKAEKRQSSEVALFDSSKW